MRSGSADYGNSTGRGVLAGAIGGIAGAAAMVGFNHLIHATGLVEEEGGGHQQHHRRHAKPNDTDGTISDEPASRQAASAAAEATVGRRLTEDEKDIGGPLMHYAFGAAAGAIYGALAAAAPRITAGAGAPYGATVFLTAGEIGVPMLGLARRPTTYPPARHAAAFATHLVFGLTLEAVRKLLTHRGR